MSMPMTLAERYATLSWLDQRQCAFVTLNCLKRLGRFNLVMEPRKLLPDEIPLLIEEDFDPSKKSAK